MSEPSASRMHRLVRATLLSVSLLVAAAAVAKTTVPELADKLASASDFRVRVQAALELGKSADERALDPLVRGLDDSNASVRAAAAAALKTLGDRRAIAPLKEHRLDRSDAVRSQIKTTIAALESDPAGDKPKVLVKLGSVQNGTNVKSPGIERQFLIESRKSLDELPGIDVLPSDELAAAATAAAEDLPVVMVTTSIQKLAASRDGDSVVYSAKVEYILHSMPDEAIAARVSGSASATASEAEAHDKARSSELRRSVIEAAVKSALRRAPPALMAAARL